MPWRNLKGSGSGSDRIESKRIVRSPTYGNLDANETKYKHRGFVTKWQVALLGISLLTAGEVMFWNSAYAKLTFVEYLVDVLLLGSAFVVAALCLAELSGTLPFGGK